MRALTKSGLVLLVVLLFGTASTVMALCPAGLSDCATATCAGGCGAAGIVGIQHFFQGFTGESGFDMTASTVFSDSCNSPGAPGGCPVRATPPLRWWAFDAFNNANSGCIPMYDGSTGNSYISSQYDSGNGQPSGIWWLVQAQWAASQTAGPMLVDGCIAAGGTTVVEFSFGDVASGEGTAAHDSWFLIASADENNSGNSIYDFDAITGAGGPTGNTIAIASAPDLSAITGQTPTGNTPVCPGDYGAASTHALNTADMAYFDVSVAVSSSSPAYFTESGMNAGAALIAGMQILYAPGPAPTTGAVDSADIATPVWLPARDPAAPGTNVAGIVPHGGATSITVSLPVAGCSGGCFLASRIIYTDATRNPGLPGPVTIATAPTLGSWTGQHCGPVIPEGVTQTFSVAFDYVAATQTPDGVRVAWRTSFEDDVFGFKVFRTSDPATDAGVEVVQWRDAMGPGFDYTELDATSSASDQSWYFVQEVTSQGLGQRSVAVRAMSSNGGRDRGGDRR